MAGWVAASAAHRVTPASSVTRCGRGEVVAENEDVTCCAALKVGDRRARESDRLELHLARVVDVDEPLAVDAAEPERVGEVAGQVAAALHVDP